MKKETSLEKPKRSAKVIASNTNIPKDRVIHISYVDDRFDQDINDKAEMIGIKDLW